MESDAPLKADADGKNLCRKPGIVTTRGVLTGFRKWEHTLD